MRRYYQVNSSNAWTEKLKALSSQEKQLKYTPNIINNISPDELLDGIKKIADQGDYDLLDCIIKTGLDKYLHSDSNKFKQVFLELIKDLFFDIPYPDREKISIDHFIEFGGDVGEICCEVISKELSFEKSEQATIELHFSEIAEQDVNKVIACFKRHSNDEKDPPSKVKEYFEELAKTLRIYGLDKVIGPYLRESYYEHLIRGKNIDKNIFIFGESGTGKSTLARIFHENSGRSGEFIEVEQNLSKEEFLRKISEAKHGTLFLDEVDRIDREIQNDILTNLPKKGMVSVSSRVNPSELGSKETIEGYFTLDFQRRIAGSECYTFKILPLSDPVRKEDCKEAIKFFWKAQTDYIDIDEEVINIFSEKYSWPGNLDQVKKIMEDIYTAKENIGHDIKKLDKNNLHLHFDKLPPDTKEIIRKIFSFV